MSSPTFPGASDPLLAQATPADLQALAASRPDLRPQIAAHPAAYGGLLTWLADVDTSPEVHAALAARAAGQLPWQQPAQQAQVPTPQPEPAQQAPAPAQAAPSEPAPQAPAPAQAVPAQAAPQAPAPAQPAPAQAAPSEPVAQQVPAAPVPTTQAAPARRRRRWPIILTVVLAVVALVAAGLGAAYVLAKPDPIAPDTSTAGTAPTKVSALRVAADHGQAVLLPMSTAGPSVISSEDRWVTKIRSGETISLVAGDRTRNVATPVWQVSLAADTDCRLVNDALVCGTQAFSLADGSETSAPDSTDSPAATRLTRLADQPVDGYTPTSPDTAWSYEVRRPSLIGGVRVPGRDQVTNVILDGNQLTAVTDGTTTWSKDLGEKASEVNGATEDTPPTLDVVGDVVLAGASDGVVGLNVGTGEPVWSVPAPDLTSWGTSTAPDDDDDAASSSAPEGTEIVVSEGDTVSRYAFPTVDDSGEVAAPSAQPVDLDQLKNATLQVPSICASRGGTTDSSTVTLTDGIFHPAGEFPMSGITLVDAVGATFGNEPVALVVWDCSAGTSYLLQSLGVYDSSLRLVGQFEGTGEVGSQEPSLMSVIQGDLQDPAMANLAADGETVTFTVPQIGLVGDSFAHAVTRSGSATVTLTWNGSGFDITDVVYHTPNGDVRVPKVEDVQKVIDTISTGDIDSVSGQLSSDVRSAFEARYPDQSDEWSVLSLYKGATVEECRLIGTLGLDATITFPTYHLASGEIETAWLSQAQPGDSVCALNYHGTDMAGGAYPLAVIVGPSSTGSVYITGLGHYWD